MISGDMRLAGQLYESIARFPEIEPITHSLSIATFRFVPRDPHSGGEEVQDYLDQLNCELLTRLQNGGEAFLSNAVVHGRFALRACIVNFHTELADVEALLPLVVRVGNELDSSLRPRLLGLMPQP
jgi:glutamate/tyrosine decarboxylase-like PLP-dependent enzyme